MSSPNSSLFIIQLMHAHMHTLIEPTTCIYCEINEKLYLLGKVHYIWLPDTGTAIRCSFIYDGSYFFPNVRTTVVKNASKVSLHKWMRGVKGLSGLISDNLILLDVKPHCNQLLVLKGNSTNFAKFLHT